LVTGQILHRIIAAFDRRIVKYEEINAGANDDVKKIERQGPQAVKGVAETAEGVTDQPFHGLKQAQAQLLQLQQNSRDQLSAARGQEPYPHPDDDEYKDGENDKRDTKAGNHGIIEAIGIALGIVNSAPQTCLVDKEG